MKKNLTIDAKMKELWPATRVGCFQYRVKVEKKNEEMWNYKCGYFQSSVLYGAYGYFGCWRLRTPYPG